MNEVGEGLDVVGVGLGCEAVAEIEDKARMNSSLIEDLGGGLEHFGAGTNHKFGVEIALDGDVRLEGLGGPGKIGFSGE